MPKTIRLSAWDRARATVFARDKAICGYTAASVWLLDLGITPFAEEEWVDHLKLRSKGGADHPDNLMCAGAYANYIRNRNPSQPPYFFLNGNPTTDFFDFGFHVTPTLARILRSNRELHPSDWYFNRAVAHVLYAAEERHYGYRDPKGRRYKRTPEYWLGAAEGFLRKWKTACSMEDKADVSRRSFERRGLVLFPRLPDTQTILDLREADSLNQIDRIARAVQGIYAINANAYDTYLAAKSPARRRTLATKISEDASIHPDIKRAVAQAQRLFADTEGPLYVD